MLRLQKSIVALLVSAACWTGAQAAPLSVAGDKVVMLVDESITTSGVVNTTARSGPLTTSGAVFSIDRFGTPSTTVPISAPPVEFSGSYGTATGFPTSGQVTDLAGAHLRGQFPGLKGALATHMRRYGISSGWFNFKQQVEVDVNGAAETWTIYWDFFTDSSGRGAFGEPKIVPADPKTLYVVYTPLRVSNDLPTSWAMDGAGTLKYQLRDTQFQPVTDWVTVNVGGVFDTLESTTEGYDSGLSCLMDTAKPGCTASVHDVKSLMDRTGAALSVVDYVRRVEPEYEDQPDGTRVPKMTSTLASRQLTYTGCTPPTFRNVGNLSYTLQSSVARYLAGSVGSPRTVQFEQIQEFRGNYLSPAIPYDLSLQVPRRDTADLATKAIDPVEKNRLMALADIPGLQYPISPIQIVGDPNATIGSTSGVVWQYGGRSDAYQMNWELKCAQYDDGFELSTTISSTHGWNGWTPNSPAKSLVSSVSWSPVAVTGFGSSRYQAHADFGRGIVFLQDGATSSSYSYRSSGGGEGSSSGFICAHNQFSLMAQNGTAYECNAPAPIDYSCPAAGPVYDHYVDGIYRGRVTQASCTGYMWIRGMYMSNGAPFYEYQQLSKIDRSPEAVSNCRDGVCAWEVRDGVEPVEPEPEPEPTPIPDPAPDPTPATDTMPAPDPSCWEDSWPNDLGCPAGYSGTSTSMTYMTCPDGPYGAPAFNQADYAYACEAPVVTPTPAEPEEQTPPQLPPTPPAEVCYWITQVDTPDCPANRSVIIDLYQHTYAVCEANGIQTSNILVSSEWYDSVGCSGGGVTEDDYNG